MIPGPDIVISCPHCAALSRLPSVAVCPVCHTFYWVEEAQRVGEIHSSFLHEATDASGAAPEWLEAPEVMEPSEADYLEMLGEKGGEFSEDDELNLRLLAWWRGNDAFRQVVPPLENDRQPPAEANMNRLLEVLDPEQLDQRLFRAELLRQLGRFEEAVETLAEISQASYINAVVRIQTLARQGSTHLDLIETY
jgi:hypothetical protein